MLAPVYVITLSGSDSSGGAGLQADNRAILMAGAFPLNVVTAVTLQTARGVEAIECMSGDFVAQQLRRLLQVYPVAAIKIGMLGSEAIASAVADVLATFPSVPYVLDPVLISTSGHCLLPAAGVRILRERLMPQATLTTPNLEELYALAEVEHGAPPIAVGCQLAESVQQYILLKGGHSECARCEDWLLGPDWSREMYSSERVDSNNQRGTGCALSSGIAARLALGDRLPAAVGWAKQILSDSLERNAVVAWTGPGPALR